MLDEYDWRDIESAPRDGTPVSLCWKHNGVVQEVFSPMVWSETETSMVAPQQPGVWVMRKGEETILTWSELLPEDGPTHWSPLIRKVNLHEH